MLLTSASQMQAADNDEPWVMVDTRRQVLAVMQNGREVKRFVNIAVGHGGTAEMRLEGDGRTPKGSFRVAWINPDSRFHLFFGLDYPDMTHAERAYQADMIDFNTFTRISAALREGKLPPQDTPLGGYIGIHGLGNKSPDMHRRLNWTDGCVALTDAQVDQLARWVSVGTRVVII